MSISCSASGVSARPNALQLQDNAAHHGYLYGPILDSLLSTTKRPFNVIIAGLEWEHMSKDLREIVAQGPEALGRSPPSKCSGIQLGYGH